MTGDKGIAEILATVYAQEKVLRRARKALSAAREGESFGAWASLRALEVLRKEAWIDDELKRLVKVSADALTEAVERLELELEAAIRGLCEQHGWRVDGQWPELFVERAIDLNWDRRSRQLSMAGSMVDDIGETRITKLLAPLVAGLIPKAYKPERFLDRFAAAYDDVTGGRGGQAPLLDVYRALVVHLQPTKFSARRTQGMVRRSSYGSISCSAH